MLVSINNYKRFKEVFRRKFYEILFKFPEFKMFLDEIYVEGTAYVVGGFLRDIANKLKPRDLDIILDVSSIKIHDALKKSNLKYDINRFGGFKILFDNFQIDVWSLENNWSFKNNLIKRNDQNIIDNIAAGSFYNFDSLVINARSLELSAKYYNQCIKKKTLDINRKNITYKKLNPTIEANIIRAVYLKEKFELNLSEECFKYLRSRTNHLKDNHNSAINRLKEVKKQYKKYEDELNDETLQRFITCLLESDSSEDKMKL